MLLWAVVMVTTLALSGPLQIADCGCFCVEGRPTTLCTSVEEAQENPALCATPPLPGTEHRPCNQNHEQVPVPPGADILQPPHEDAHSCATRRVWDARAEQFRLLKLCAVSAT